MTVKIQKQNPAKKTTVSSADKKAIATKYKRDMEKRQVDKDALLKKQAEKAKAKAEKNAAREKRQAEKDAEAERRHMESADAYHVQMAEDGNASGLLEYKNITKALAAHRQTATSPEKFLKTFLFSTTKPLLAFAALVLRLVDTRIGKRDDGCPRTERQKFLDSTALQRLSAVAGHALAVMDGDKPETVRSAHEFETRDFVRIKSIDWFSAEWSDEHKTVSVPFVDIYGKTRYCGLLANHDNMLQVTEELVHRTVSRRAGEK